jgi:hypothetical protein
VLDHRLRSQHVFDHAYAVGLLYITGRPGWDLGKYGDQLNRVIPLSPMQIDSLAKQTFAIAAAAGIDPVALADRIKALAKQKE